MSLAALARLQQRQRAPLGDQQRRGEVVDLHPLLQELRVVLRHLVSQHHMAERLQRQRSGVVLAGVGLRQVDDPVRQVGDGPGGFGQVGGVRQPEAQVGGQPVDHGPGDRAAVVLGGGQQVGGHGLDLAEVVALPAHPVAQVGVGPPGLLRGGGPLGLDPGHRPVQADERLQGLGLQPRPRPDRRDVQRLERGRALRLLQLDLQRRPPAGRGDRQQIGEVGCPARRQGGQQRQLRLPLAVLDQRERRRADGRRPRRPRSSVRPAALRMCRSRRPMVSGSGASGPRSVLSAPIGLRGTLSSCFDNRQGGTRLLLAGLR